MSERLSLIYMAANVPVLSVYDAKQKLSIQFISLLHIHMGPELHNVGYRFINDQ